uniref:Uncharacterized protein n=1 Tax=Fibrocapsa japonica TaxID=94617 RepID=A0A7S2V267_9STRA|eukprot:CAMPEP_0113944426 /NCGR_PEP_ID=MMETSP1339-20121228/34416_1 /TAXON_ID=94617 /ORGANISM="Fibrocapsa japonica" /LENGTH=246 /DNA_ID=CAMNT_0000949633 /DNA_START=86 /DNA_END=826 /DNA_ORIENTATION=+ /assembly_acc=CAM_ASM_000762
MGVVFHSFIFIWVFSYNALAFSQNSVTNGGRLGVRDSIISLNAKKSRAIPTTSSELSRKFSLDNLRWKHHRVVIDADDDERKALAERLKLPQIQSLTGEVTCTRLKDVPTVIKVMGKYHTTVVQSCVISGNHFDAEYQNTFETYLREEREEKDDVMDIVIIPEEVESKIDEDVPESGTIDLGDIFCQYVSLGIDPMRKHPDMVAWDEMKTKSIGSNSDEFEEEEGWETSVIEFNSPPRRPKKPKKF